MKIRFSAALLFVLAVSVGVSAQKASTSEQTERELRRHVQYLASDELAGRRTGEQGATFAAGYVSNQFAKAKLAPGIRNARTKPAYLQLFPYVSGVFSGTETRLATANARYGRRFEKSADFAPFANSSNGTVAPSPVVFAGFGIATPDKKYDDYAGVETNGKVVLAFDGIPEADSAPSPFAAFTIHSKANLAKERGAAALLLISRSDVFADDPLSRSIYEPTIGETAIPVMIISRKLGAEMLGLDRPSELSEIEKWMAMRTNAPPAIRIKLSDPTGSRAEVSVVLEKQNADAYNVIGILEGRDKTLKDEAIVIGAHYDHLGRGGRSSLSPNSTDIHHGADDNASGTAALIELASHFAREKKNKRTIIFIAFGGEEEGLLGSKYYVDHPVWPLDKTVAMINMDMIGRLNAKKLTIGGIGTASEWPDIVERMNRRETGTASESGTAATGRFDLQLNQDGFGPSDHASFYGKNIPVLFLFTGTHLDYHKPSDTADKINFEGLAQITNYVANVAKAIDSNATRPTYTVAQSAGMGGRTSFSVSLGTIPSYSDANDGLTIDGVRDGSPAAKAGLNGGDRIIKMAGKYVRNISDYMFAMSAMKAGEEYEVVVVRGTDTLTLKIIPAPAARQNRER